MTQPGKILAQAGVEPGIFRSRGGCLNHWASEAFFLQIKPGISLDCGNTGPGPASSTNSILGDVASQVRLSSEPSSREDLSLGVCLFGVFCCFLCLVGCFSMIILTPAVLSVLYACACIFVFAPVQRK